MSDRSFADDTGPAAVGLETELRAALHERSAGITSATLLRPDPPGLQEFSTRRPLTRWRMVGAVAAVSAVILAVVVGRGVMAPQQQVRTGVPAASAVSSPVRESWFPMDKLADRLWVATTIRSGNSAPVSLGTGAGKDTMIAEFDRAGMVVFHDGNNEVRGRFSIGGSSITVTGATGWVAPSVSRTDSYLQETAALGALLAGMPAAVILRGSLIGSQLTLSHGDATIVYVSEAVTPAAAVAAGLAHYPLAAVVGETWQAATVGIDGQNFAVSTPVPVTFTLAADGSFVVDMAGAVLRGRWWATGDGLAVTGVSESGTSALDRDGSAASPRSQVLVALMAAAASVGSGDVTVSLAAQGAQLVVTPLSEPRIPVTFVRR